jgi:signal transduction histidine kinase
MAGDQMKLSRFINSHINAILAEWESFACTLLPAAQDMSALALRDHARKILEELTVDIDTDQTDREQYVKSQGRAPDAMASESAASTHGTLRQISGFSLLQLTAEYRALRATVLRLWLATVTEFNESISEDMVRFNEAIDQALAESVVTYSENTHRTRDTFLGILGHDLRSPLAAISLSGDYLTSQGVGNEATQKIGVRVKRSATTMSTMVNDLLEYARMQLGGEMPFTPHDVDLKDICSAAIHDAQAVHPDCQFRLGASGDLKGHFDGVRLQQVFTNLLNNAAQYRGKEFPVTILADGDAESLVVQVKNFGPVIPPESLQAIFNPLVQLSVDEEQEGRLSTSLGLGLYIVREITAAHEGAIDVTSTVEQGTTFSVRIPRVRRHDGIPPAE